jgi:N-acetyl-anhydromuramyl-L-alanine amidase AmpD
MAMGERYLTDLADVLRRVGLDVYEENGWQQRARSSGGYDGGPIGISVHHTASTASRENDVAYMCYNADARPVANLLLDRDGRWTVMAGGATNTAGKGGPRSTSQGTIPLDSANSRTIGVEAANNGIGEVWSDAMCESYVIGVRALCDAYGLVTGDVFSHFEWSPGRKYDPAGQSHWASGSDLWDMDAYRHDLEGEDDMPSLDDIKQALRDVLNEGAPFGTGGNPAFPGQPWAEGNVNAAGTYQDTYNVVTRVEAKVDQLLEGGEQRE